MKTTIDIGDALFDQIRQLAQRNRTTFKALVEEGLRRVLDEHSRRSEFQLRDAGFQGEGLNPDFADASWSEIRGAAYRDRGG
jgi:hypothetical protein